MHPSRMSGQRRSTNVAVELQSAVPNNSVPPLGGAFTGGVATGTRESKSFAAVCSSLLAEPEKTRANPPLPSSISAHAAAQSAIPAFRGVKDLTESKHQESNLNVSSPSSLSPSSTNPSSTNPSSTNPSSINQALASLSPVQPLVPTSSIVSLLWPTGTTNRATAEVSQGGVALQFPSGFARFSEATKGPGNPTLSPAPGSGIALANAPSSRASIASPNSEAGASPMPLSGGGALLRCTSVPENPPVTARSNDHDSADPAETTPDSASALSSAGTVFSGSVCAGPFEVEPGSTDPRSADPTLGGTLVPVAATASGTSVPANFPPIVSAPSTVSASSTVSAPSETTGQLSPAVLPASGDTGATVSPARPSRVIPQSFAKQPLVEEPAVPLPIALKPGPALPSVLDPAHSVRNVSTIPPGNQFTLNVESSNSSTPSNQPAAPSSPVPGPSGFSVTSPITPHLAANSAAGAITGAEKNNGGNRSGATIVSTSQSETSNGNSSDSFPQTAAAAAPANGTPTTSPQVAPIASPNPVPPSVVQPAVPLDSPRKTGEGARSGSADASALPSAPAEAPANSGPGPVQMAQMVNKAAQSEMRIELNTSAFGNVEVHTVVRANEVGLLIGSEKGDLRALFSNELPALTNILQKQNLQLNPVNFLQGFAFSNQSSGGDSHQRSFVRPEGPQFPSRDVRDGESTAPAGVSETRYSSGSLSILA